MSERPQNKHLKPAKPGEIRNPNGRPKGSRNKLAEQFLADFYTLWLDEGKGALDRMVKERPHEFVKVAASLIPSEANLKITDGRPIADLTTAELAQRTADALERIEELTAGTKRPKSANRSSKLH